MAPKKLPADDPGPTDAEQEPPIGILPDGTLNVIASEDALTEEDADV